MSFSLSSRRAVTDLLNRHGLRPDKSFGQNFLVDQNALNAIVAAAELTGDQTVLEFGPGPGNWPPGPDTSCPWSWTAA